LLYKKHVSDIGIADQQNAGKQGGDDNRKPFSTQLHPVHIFNVAA